VAISFETFKELYIRIKKGDFESDRKLAKEYGINRNCLYQIRQKRHRYFALLGESEDPSEAVVYPSLDENDTQKSVRCKKCGGKVRAGIPCYACSVKEYREKKLQKAIENLTNKQLR
jgi:hypothetical protein